MELSEVRTLHTRAVTALNALHRMNKWKDHDPEIREMIDSLHKVELLLAPWARKNPKLPAPLAPLPSREEILGTFVKGR